MCIRDRSNASGDRLKEAQHINKSLSSLGDVFSALLKSNGGHIPYRNSKLTYLLQDSLGRDSKTLMFVNVSADKPDESETLSSLQFAQRVSKVELGRAKKHNDPNLDPERLQQTDQQNNELLIKLRSVQMQVRKRDEDIVHLKGRARGLESELSHLKYSDENQSSYREGSANEVRELRAVRERDAMKLEGVAVRLKNLERPKHEEIPRFHSVIRCGDKVIDGLSAGSTPAEDARHLQARPHARERVIAEPKCGPAQVHRMEPRKRILRATSSLTGKSRKVRLDIEPDEIVSGSGSERSSSDGRSFSGPGNGMTENMRRKKRTRSSPRSGIPAPPRRTKDNDGVSGVGNTPTRTISATRNTTDGRSVASSLRYSSSPSINSGKTSGASSSGMIRKRTNGEKGHPPPTDKNIISHRPLPPPVRHTEASRISRIPRSKTAMIGPPKRVLRRPGGASDTAAGGNISEGSRPSTLAETFSDGGGVARSNIPMLPRRAGMLRNVGNWTTKTGGNGN